MVCCAKLEDESGFVHNKGKTTGSGVTETVTFDKQSLDRDYEAFVQLHDQCIEQLKHAPKTLASMGIVRSAS